MWWRKWYGGPLILAFAFWLASYFITNINTPISGEKTVITKFEFIRGLLFKDKLLQSDSVIYIDVSYDKQLVPICDSATEYWGTDAITDRDKLFRLLQFFKQDSTYRYILLDIDFEKGYKTDTDSILFATILSMPRIIIPKDVKHTFEDEKLDSIAGFVNYYTTPTEGGFVKYPYLCSKGKSLPLKMYEANAGHTIKRIGPFYFDRHHLSRKCVVLTFYNRCIEYGNLGYWVDTIYDQNTLIPPLISDPDINVSDKYIIIGSLQGYSDRHNTYLGNLYGPEINFNAYLSLLKGHHRISVFVAFLLFFVFYYFCYKTLYQKRIVYDYLYNRKWKGWRYLGICIAWIDYPLLMTIICIFTYVSVGEVYDIFITSLLFWGFDIIVKITNRFNQTNKRP